MTAESDTIAYIRDRLSQNVTPRLWGNGAFIELRDSGLITPYWTLFRTFYTHGTIDPYYQMNDDGKFLQLRIDDPQPLDPLDVLSEEKAPDGWEVDKIRFPSQDDS